MRELAEAVGISTEQVHFTLHELRMKKLCARWVPHLVTPEQKKTSNAKTCIFLIFFSF